MALGSLIFFDDYSSILIVGNSLRDVVRAVGVREPRRAGCVFLLGMAWLPLPCEGGTGGSKV